jgi:hypothetical protein
MGAEGSARVGVISLAIDGARALPITANCNLSTGWGTGVDFLETSARAVSREKTSKGAVPWYGWKVVYYKIKRHGLKINFSPINLDQTINDNPKNIKSIWQLPSVSPYVHCTSVFLNFLRGDHPQSEIS